MFVAGDKLESGHYTVIKVLGQGGMGVVYHCHDEALQRDVAIKLLLPELTMNKETLDGFIQEARLAAQLEHPNIVTIYEIGKEERGNKVHHYIAMEYLTGGNLASRIDAKQLSIEHCLNWMKQLSNGLAYAHKRGIVHQDIKADNIFITTEGDLKIGDFGLARLAAGRIKGRSGHHGMGTPAYMSPELCRGDPQDHRSDIYSMGILFYEMATGQLPYKARGMIEMAMKHTSAPIPSARRLNPQVPEALDRVIQKMMAKQPGDRYQDMAQVLAILDDLIFELRVARLGLAPKTGAAGRAGGSGFFERKSEPAAPGTAAAPFTEPVVSRADRARSGPLFSSSGAPFTTSGPLPVVEPAMPPLDGAPARTSVGPPAGPAPAPPLRPAGEAAPTPPPARDIARKHLELVWAFHSYGPIGWKSSPVLSRDGSLIYCGSADGSLYALDARLGTKIWGLETGGPLLGSVALVQDKLIAASTDGHVYALTARAGTLIWKRPAGSPIVCTPSVCQENVLVGTMDGELLCLFIKSGEERWRFKTGDAVVSNPEVSAPAVYVTSKDRHLYALGLNSGQLNWKFQAPSPLISGPIAASDSVYLGGMDGVFYGLDADSGKVIWQYETSRPIIAKGVIHFTAIIFCGQDRWLYCCEKYDGRLIWKAPVRGRVTGNLSQHGEGVCVVTREGWVQCFHVRTGEIKWQMDTKRRLESAPLITGDMLYLGTVDGDVLAYCLSGEAKSPGAYGVA